MLMYYTLPFGLQLDGIVGLLVLMGMLVQIMLMGIPLFPLPNE
jgi:tetrahydromethanopterin S-methyltransferase subunit F